MIYTRYAYYSAILVGAVRLIASLSLTSLLVLLGQHFSSDARLPTTLNSGQVQSKAPLPRLSHRHHHQPCRLRHHLALRHPPTALALGGAGGHHRLEQRHLRLHPRLLRQPRCPADGQPHDLRTLPS